MLNIAVGMTTWKFELNQSGKKILYYDDVAIGIHYNPVIDSYSSDSVHVKLN